MTAPRTDADVIYDVSRNIDMAKDRLHKDFIEGEISKESEGLILRFLRDLDISKHSQYFYLQRLRVIAKVLGGNFVDSTSDKVKDAIYELKNTKTRMGDNFSERSIDDIYQTMKRFYGWYEDGKFLESVNKIKRNNHRSHEKKPKDVVTQSELKAMLSACNNLRDRTVI